MNIFNKRQLISRIKISKDKLYIFFLLIIIITTTLVVYSSALKNNFINWDDNAYVYENKDITSIDANHIKNWFTKNYVFDYLPLAIFSYAIDYQFAKLNPVVYILTNLIIHLLDIIFVFLFISQILKIIEPDIDLKKLNITSGITALLFAIHPLNVESVAWIAERKNILFTFFFLLSLICYLKYIEKKKISFYLFSLFMFLLSLLSKGTAVSLTLCIVIIDITAKRKLLSKKIILEKIPFIIISIFFGILAFLAQGAPNVKLNHTWYEQIVFISYGFINYLLKLVIPINLSAFYSYPNLSSVLPWVYLIVCLAIIGLVIYNFKRITNPIKFAISFYLVNIVFLIQIIPVGEAVMADRYIYVSSIGFFLITSILIYKLSLKFPIIYVILILMLIYYGFTTYQRCKIWNNKISFWNKVIDSEPNFPKAWLNRGFAKNENNDITGAITDFNEAIKLNPTYYDAYYNRGIARACLHDINGALNDFNQAIILNPTYEEYYNRGIAKANLHDMNGALYDFSQAIILNPTYAEAYNNRGLVKRELGDNTGASNDYNSAIINNPELIQAYNNRGILKCTLNGYNEAINDFTKAIQLDNLFTDAYYNLGKTYKIISYYDKALYELNQLLLINPQYLKAYLLRAKIKLKLNDYNGTLSDCNTALNFDKNLINARIVKIAALYQMAMYSDAMDEVNLMAKLGQKQPVLVYLKGLINLKSGHNQIGIDEIKDAQNMGIDTSKDITEILN